MNNPLSNKEYREYDAWRDGIIEQLPELCTKVFSLRGKAGQQWDIERKLGNLIKTVNDYENPPRTEDEVMFIQISVDIFLKTIDNEVAR